MSLAAHFRVLGAVSILLMSISGLFGNKEWSLQFGIIGLFAVLYSIAILLERRT
jgi:hypothetical protein